MASLVRVAAASIGPANGDLSASLREADHAVARLAADGAQLIVLPELFVLPYTAGEDPSEWPIHAEPLDGPTCRWAQAAALRNETNIVFGMALDNGADKPLNAAVLARPDGTMQPVASKRHLPPPVPGDRFGEADHFTPGDADIACFDLCGIRVAVLVCYDRRIPERWHAASHAGADLVLVLVAGPAPQDSEDTYLTELRGHAWAHAVHVLAAARSGTETVLGHPVRHDGLTVAVDPSGVVRSCGRGSPYDHVLIDLDPDEIERLRRERTSRGSSSTIAPLVN